jgi:glyoxylase-like metal-dependent hydrolase (beta-lactamase superfamily II)
MPTESWRVGDVTITKVVEREMSFPIEFLGQVLPSASRTEIETLQWLRPDYVCDGATQVGYYSFLIQTSEAKVVVDTAVGNSKARALERFNMLDTAYPANFRAVWNPVDVDAVVSTHLHPDHVGWNTRAEGGAWVPTFASATYYLVELEYRYWKRFVDCNDPVNPAFDAVNVFNDSILPVVDAGLVSFVGPDAAITPEISLIPSHGHTPGHVSVLIESNGDSAVITGDLMHSPCQIGHPEWSCAYDADQEAAAVTRRAFLDRFADTGTLVIGTHFGTPTGVLVQRDGAAFRLTPAG